MVGRVVGAVAVLLVLGLALGYGAGALLQDDPATIRAVDPVPAASPSVPVEPEAPYAQDIDFPTLGTALSYRREVVGEGEFTWGYVAPKGWIVSPIGPNELTWTPPGLPESGGGYGMRVKVVSERKTPEAMVEQKIQDLADAVAEVKVIGRTTSSLSITYRALPSNRERFNTFRWFTRPGETAAEFEVSVVGRQRDVEGLDDLLDQIAASVQFQPPPLETPSPSASPSGSGSPSPSP